MSTVPLYSPKFQAFDTNGFPLAGGKLYSYAAGTSTPLPTYTTRAGDVPNTNPVILDANGEADIWTTPGVLYKFVLTDSGDTTRWTEDNVPGPADSLDSSSGGGGGTADADTLDPGGRLTFATGNSVPTLNVTGAGTVFYTPHKHNQVPIWDGAKWVLFSFTELAQAASDTTKSPGAVVASTLYDCFVWDDSGTLRLSRGPAWTSDTSRGTGSGTTELVRIDSRWVNKWAISNGPSGGGGLYVGTVCSNASALFDDSLTTRHVWNAFHRAPRPMKVSDATSTWSYKAAAYRQANANAANQLDFVVGIQQEPVSVELAAQVAVTVASDTVGVAIGVGSTTPFGYRDSTLIPAGGRAAVRAKYLDLPLGRTVLLWLETGSNTASAVDTWQSDGGISASMSGVVLA